MMKPPKALNVFRWQYVVPRVCAALALVLAVRFGLDPLVRWTLVASGEAALGAKVEIGALTTSIGDAELIISNVAAANPKKPMRNLLEADELHLRLDGNQLLRKRVVVRDGSIRGLRFDSPRTTSGALAPVDPADAGPSMFDPVVESAQEHALAWFDDLSGRVEDDLMTVLATPRLAKELEERWPRQYEALKTRTDELRTKAKGIETTFREVKKNPLRNLVKIEELQAALKATETRLRDTLAEIRGLPNQAKADRAALDVARKQDEQFIREHLNLAEVDGPVLSRYLLGEEAANYLSQTAWWVQQIRDVIPQSKMTRPARLPGTNVLFVDRRLPKFLVERVELAGAARLDGQELTFAGELTDATPEPKLHGRPLRMRLTTSGATECLVTVQVDRRGEVSHDSLVFDCPKLQLPHRVLGKADRFAVTVAPGEASLCARVKLDGDQLSGVIELRQASSLAAATPMIRDDRLVQVLHESLMGVNRFEATVQLSGTLQRPGCTIESNIGPQIAVAVNGAVRRYLTERKDRLVAKVQGKVDEQMAKLESARQKAQQELQAKLGEDQQLVSQLASMLGVGGKPSLDAVSVPQIGKAFEKLQR